MLPMTWTFVEDELGMQWESITSCCRMLFGLATSKTVAVTLETQFGSQVLLNTLGILCMLHPGNDLCNCCSGRSVLCKDSAALPSFVKRSLSNSVRAMQEMIQRQKDAVATLGIEFSVKHPLFALLVRHSEWILNHLVRNDSVDIREVTKELSQEPVSGSGQRDRQLLSRLLWLDHSNLEAIRRADAESEKDMTMRWGMADDCYAKDFGVACWHPREVQNIVSSPPPPPQATKYDLERTVRHHVSLQVSSE